VPVLSVHTKVVDPNVSTASRCRTNPLRRAIRWAATDNDSVTVGRSPSGTNATVIPTAKMKPASGGVPSSSMSPKNTPPTPSATVEIVRTTCRS
jgi:hypothetical protein